MTSAILGLTVGLFPFQGLAVTPLGFHVIPALPCHATFITAVGLPFETTPANIEKNVTPLASELTQQQNKPAFGLAIRRKQAYDERQLLYWASWIGCPKKRPGADTSGLLFFAVSFFIRILANIRTNSKENGIYEKIKRLLAMGESPLNRHPYHRL